MNKYIISSVLVGVLSVSYLALAEDSNKNVSILPTNVSASPAVKVKMREQKDQLQKNIKDAKTKVRVEIKDAKAELKNTTEAVREDIQKRREEFKETVKTKREALKDEIKTKREELKTRLEKIKDVRKKETVERIDQRMDALNEKMVQHFSNVLDKLEEMMVRVSKRADRVSTERGLDVSEVRLAAEKAITAIALARTAVETQSGKTYTIKVTSESALKVDVGKARQSLGADLVEVRDAVKAAHSAVKDAAVALAQLVVKPKISPTPTTSPSISPSPASTSSPQATPVQ
ncbi:MAG: hypothetical protein A2915_03525 [Candidatus Yanofskybacteria bacterium RIFCSPLOWO2_01_FULL_41_34]|uniref:DUF5667 domain-containing protein n=1 Tax=Candidatus Yanofskybacteria bacterium RIFCSPHIGHO2_01_FULL_41_26 TaxID=1802661 RepID=A0A1F8EDQ4_9BACT|nr:MAG: hypothetical protein A2649_01420 [Candidatus Yanofskybacteria bacterium RIFCSPHIGHO2_01_FULL_41_26]OGN21099.1 MAG: hypothetical protein A2915_03525 [Candidatus Yanofskybacteria bacterium RIFCSPLOWO2_01_FULL_41_34]